MGEENRVLTLDEALELPVDTTYWVEEAKGSDLSSREYDNRVEDMDGLDDYGAGWRVWLREPTVEELTTNPWPTPIVEV